MRLNPALHRLNLLILAATLVLSSCGGGTNTAGAGGSGIGGTGITTVTGNISQIITTAPDEEQALARRMIAGLVNWLSAPANAQAAQLGGVRVIGGGQSTTTDDSGAFVLEDVRPSDSFNLSFIFEDNQTITLPIGQVTAGKLVQVNDIVIDTAQGFANAGDVEIEDNPAQGNRSGNAPGNSQNASNNNAGGASGKSSENSSGVANNASNNNKANNASEGANSNN